MSLLRRRVEATTVWLPESCEAAILDETVDRAPNETGGILLGYEVPDRSALVITHLVAAGPGARYRRGLFEPDGPWQEREVARIYAESGRRASYLGDWHSHPDGVAAPSKKDHHTARAIACHRAARMRRPLMLIVANDDQLWRIRVFRLGGRRLRPAELSLYGPEFMPSVAPMCALQVPGVDPPS